MLAGSAEQSTDSGGKELHRGRSSRHSCITSSSLSCSQMHPCSKDPAHACLLPWRVFQSQPAPACRGPSAPSPLRTQAAV